MLMGDSIMYCKNCGNQLRESDIFCGNCGTRKVEFTLNNNVQSIESNNQILSHPQKKKIHVPALIIACIFGIGYIIIWIVYFFFLVFFSFVS